MTSFSRGTIDVSRHNREGKAGSTEIMRGHGFSYRCGVEAKQCLIVLRSVAGGEEKNRVFNLFYLCVFAQHHSTQPEHFAVVS